VCVGVLAVTAPPAAAHPFGDPPVARVAATGDTVTVRWSATADDVLALGFHVEAFPQRQVYVFDEDGQQLGPQDYGELEAGEGVGDLPTEVPPSQAELMAGSPEVRRYLLEHVTVRQDGRACPGQVVATDDFIDAGAELSFRCPDDVAEIELAVSMLNDLHPAYRTVVVPEQPATPAQTLHTDDEPARTITFGAPATPLADNAPILGAAAAAVVVVVGVVGGRRIRRRRARSDSPKGGAPEKGSSEKVS
jgi:hypothetical protein